MKFRKRPVVIEAMQYTGDNGAEVKAWVNAFNREIGFPSVTWFVTRTMTASTGGQTWRYIAEGRGWSADVIAAVYDELHETWVGVKRGQWIIRGVQGEFYPCDPDVFERTYEPEPSD